MKVEVKGEERLWLKWGTLKTWHFNSEQGKALLEEYDQLGSCMSAMAQRDTPRQKEIICELIDICDGEVGNDWDGTVYTDREKAKEYVMNHNID